MGVSHIKIHDSGNVASPGQPPHDFPLYACHVGHFVISCFVK